MWQNSELEEAPMTDLQNVKWMTLLSADSVHIRFAEKQLQRAGSANLGILSALVRWQKWGWGGGHLKYHPALRYVQTICVRERTNGTFGFYKMQRVSAFELLKEDSAPCNV